MCRPGKAGPRGSRVCFSPASRWTKKNISTSGTNFPPTRRTLKAHLIHRVLHLRMERPEAFAGDYEPLALGPDHVGFVRGGAIRVVVPLRAGDRADGGDRDLLPEYDQELSVLA